MSCAIIAAMRRRTKIVATLGPASDKPKTLTRMITAGMTVARLNFSHGDADDHRRRAGALREAASAAGRDVGLLCDLQGPKIRVGDVKDNTVELVTGDTVELTTTEQVSDAIFSTYIVAFEAISVLLLAALIGAIVVARKE